MPRLKMHGPAEGRHIVHDFLKVAFPLALIELRLEWGKTDITLPSPVLYVPHEPDALDRWPTVAVATGVESTTRRIEHGDEGGEFVTTYPMEVYTWVNAEGRGAVMDMRDTMATAMKVVLLDNPTFARPAQDYLLLEQTFEQRFSDIQKVKGDRFVAGSMCAFDVAVVEHLGPYGSQSSDTVERVVVRGYSEGTPFSGPSDFPEHPAFD